MKGQERVQSTSSMGKPDGLHGAREESGDEKHLQELKDDFCRRSGMVGGDCVPVGFYQEKGWNLWKNQIPSGGALGQQKVGAVVKVVKDSQCQPGPDSREHDAGS